MSTSSEPSSLHPPASASRTGLLAMLLLVIAPSSSGAWWLGQYARSGRLSDWAMLNWFTSLSPGWRMITSGLMSGVWSFALVSYTLSIPQTSTFYHGSPGWRWTPDDSELNSSPTDLDPLLASSDTSDPPGRWAFFFQGLPSAPHPKAGSSAISLRPGPFGVCELLGWAAVVILYRAGYLGDDQTDATGWKFTSVFGGLYLFHFAGTLWGVRQAKRGKRQRAQSEAEEEKQHGNSSSAEKI